MPELSVLDDGKEPDGIESVMTIDVNDQNVTAWTDTVMPDGESRSGQIGGPLDGGWYPTEPLLRAERSFSDVSSSVLEYSLFVSDVNMFYTRWQVSSDGTLLVALGTEIRPPEGRAYRRTRVYRRVD